MSRKPNRDLTWTRRLVREGDPIPIECEGGYVRRAAPTAGVLYERDEDAHFVSVMELQADLNAIRPIEPESLAPVVKGAKRR